MLSYRELQIYHWCLWDYIVGRMEQERVDLYREKSEFIGTTGTENYVINNRYLCHYYSNNCTNCRLFGIEKRRCHDFSSTYQSALLNNDRESAVKIRDIFGDATRHRHQMYNYIVMDTLRRTILSGGITNVYDYVQKGNELNAFLEGRCDYSLLETPQDVDRFVKTFIAAGGMIETDTQKAAEIIETAYADVTLL